jgi:hypothetical protein
MTPKRGTRAEGVRSRVARTAAERVTRSPGRPGWTTVRQHGDAWLEHDACGRTFFQATDQRAHEKTCT